MGPKKNKQTSQSKKQTPAKKKSTPAIVTSLKAPSPEDGVASKVPSPIKNVSTPKSKTGTVTTLKDASPTTLAKKVSTPKSKTGTVTTSKAASPTTVSTPKIGTDKNSAAANSVYRSSLTPVRDTSPVSAKKTIRAKNHWKNLNETAEDIWGETQEQDDLYHHNIGQATKDGIDSGNERFASMSKNDNSNIAKLVEVYKNYDSTIWDVLNDKTKFEEASNSLLKICSRPFAPSLIDKINMRESCILCYKEMANLVIRSLEEYIPMTAAAYTGKLLSQLKNTLLIDYKDIFIEFFSKIQRLKYFVDFLLTGIPMTKLDFDRLQLTRLKDSETTLVEETMISGVENETIKKSNDYFNETIIKILGRGNASDYYKNIFNIIYPKVCSFSFFSLAGLIAIHHESEDYNDLLGPISSLHIYKTFSEIVQYLSLSFRKAYELLTLKNEFSAIAELLNDNYGINFEYSIPSSTIFNYSDISIHIIGNVNIDYIKDTCTTKVTINVRNEESIDILENTVTSALTCEEMDVYQHVHDIDDSLFDVSQAVIVVQQTADEFWKGYANNNDMVFRNCVNRTQTYQYAISNGFASESDKDSIVINFDKFTENFHTFIRARDNANFSSYCHILSLLSLILNTSCNNQLPRNMTSCIESPRINDFINQIIYEMGGKMAETTFDRDQLNKYNSKKNHTEDITMTDEEKSEIKLIGVDLTAWRSKFRKALSRSVVNIFNLIKCDYKNVQYWAINKTEEELDDQFRRVFPKCLRTEDIKIQERYMQFLLCSIFNLSFTNLQRYEVLEGYKKLIDEKSSRSKLLPIVFKYYSPNTPSSGRPTRTAKGSRGGGGGGGGKGGGSAKKKKRTSNKKKVEPKDLFVEKVMSHTGSNLDDLVLKIKWEDYEYNENESEVYKDNTSLHGNAIIYDYFRDNGLISLIPESEKIPVICEILSHKPNKVNYTLFDVDFCVGFLYSNKEEIKKYEDLEKEIDKIFYPNLLKDYCLNERTLSKVYREKNPEPVQYKEQLLVPNHFLELLDKYKLQLSLDEKSYKKIVKLAKGYIPSEKQNSMDTSDSFIEDPLTSTHVYSKIEKIDDYKEFLQSLDTLFVTSAKATKTNNSKTLLYWKASRDASDTIKSAYDEMVTEAQTIDKDISFDKFIIQNSLLDIVGSDINGATVSLETLKKIVSSINSSGKTSDKFLEDAFPALINNVIHICNSAYFDYSSTSIYTVPMWFAKKYLYGVDNNQSPQRDDPLIFQKICYSQKVLIPFVTNLANVIIRFDFEMWDSNKSITKNTERVVDIDYLDISAEKIIGVGNNSNSIILGHVQHVITRVLLLFSNVKKRAKFLSTVTEVELKFEATETLKKALAMDKKSNHFSSFQKNMLSSSLCIVLLFLAMGAAFEWNDEKTINRISLIFCSYENFVPEFHLFLAEGCIFGNHSEYDDDDDDDDEEEEDEEVEEVEEDEEVDKEKKAKEEKVLEEVKAIKKRKIKDDEDNKDKSKKSKGKKN